MERIRLTPRLQAAAGFVRPGDRVADVGTDHGYLPVWLRQENVSPRVIASDIRPGPLASARASARRWEVEGIDFRLCPGLRDIRSEEADTVVIAGMSGETMIGILAACAWDWTGKRLILVMTADKGLAGAYTSNACKAAHALVEDKANTQLIVTGRRGVTHFRNRGFNVVQSYVGMSDRPDFETARRIAMELIKRFETGDVKEVYMVYTRFISAISCEAQSVQLLPFKHEGNGDTGIHTEYIYEPDAATVLGFLLPQYLYTTVYASMLQSAASEVSSRMNAMSNATDNADDLMHKLDLYYNKVRQAGITTELTEIVGGAAALE